MSITLTENAAKRIQTYLDKRGSGVGLRLGIRKAGCSGYSYAIDFADTVEADDQVFEDRGVKVVVKQEYVTYLDGVQLDFVKDGLSESFKFRNPNVKDACGCGDSFGI